MERRFRYFVLVLAICVILLTPQLIRADDGLTLESLAEKIETLFQGQSGLQSRVAAIETQLAPTPTRTPRPTPPATITAQARSTRNAARAQVTATARAKSQARAKATATAQARATEEAGNQLSVVEYLEAITFNADMVKMAMEGVTASFRNPQLTDSEWREWLDLWLDTFPYVQEEMAALAPPTSLKRGHDTFLRGISYCVTGAELVAEGVKNLDNSKFTEAAVEFEDCTRITAEALRVVGR